MGRGPVDESTREGQNSDLLDCPKSPVVDLPSRTLRVSLVGAVVRRSRTGTEQGEGPSGVVEDIRETVLRSLSWLWW